MPLWFYGPKFGQQLKKIYSKVYSNLIYIKISMVWWFDNSPEFLSAFEKTFFLDKCIPEIIRRFNGI